MTSGFCDTAQPEGNTNLLGKRKDESPEPTLKGQNIC